MRGIVAALLMLAASPAAAEEIARVSGEVTAANYRAFAAFLDQSMDKIVGLDISFRRNDDYTVGKLSAYKDGDLFLAYLPGPDSDTQISARSGFALEGAAYVFDGFFKVTYGGMGQGITAIVLEKANAPAGADAKDIDIGSLKAPGQ